MNPSPRRGMGQLEAEVMTVLWDAKCWLTPGAVLERISGEPAVGYSTVMTILRRLWKKGQLDRRREGKAFAYHPVRGREEQAAERMVALLDTAQDPKAALTHFLDVLDAGRRRQLQLLLERGRR